MRVDIARGDYQELFKMRCLQIATLAGLAALGACSKEGSTVQQPSKPSANQMLDLPMTGAVQNSDTEQVRRLAEKHEGLDERNPDNQATPMINASDTDQWPVVEILIDHGADIWAHDEFGITSAQRTLTSRILHGSDEDKARIRVIEKLKARGYPFPPPGPDEVLALDKAGKWPPQGIHR